MSADNIRTVAKRDEYFLYRSWYLDERKPERKPGCLSALLVPMATAGCVLVTLVLGGGF